MAYTAYTAYTTTPGARTASCGAVAGGPCRLRCGARPGVVTTGNILPILAPTTSGHSCHALRSSIRRSMARTSPLPRPASTVGSCGARGRRVTGVNAGAPPEGSKLIFGVHSRISYRTKWLGICTGIQGTA